MARVLSLDGGGTWALVQVKALMQLFPRGAQTRGSEVLGRFDLVAANSGGAIVLAGLAADLTLGELLERFLDESFRRAVFQPRPGPGLGLGLRRLAGALGVGQLYDVVDPRYSARAKLAALRRILPGADVLMTSLPERLGISTQLLVVAFDYDRLRATLFRSSATSAGAALATTVAPTLIEAVHASSNAPRPFFDDPAEVGARRYWDGAVAGFNNPALAGVIELLSRSEGRPAPAGPVRVLSLGTGTIALAPPQDPAELPELRAPIDRPGLRADAARMATCIIDDPPDAASFACHVLLGGGLPPDPLTPITEGPIVRLSPLVAPAWSPTARRWGVPAAFDPAAFRRLLALEMDAVRADDVDLIARLGDAWIAGAMPNQAIRAGADLHPLIGHGRFEEGAAVARAWLAEPPAPSRGAALPRAPVAAAASAASPQAPTAH